MKREEETTPVHGTEFFALWGNQPMIRYQCDVCKRELDPEEERRFVVKMELYQAFDPLHDDEGDDDRDYLQEIHELIERRESLDDELDEEAFQQMRFDLCPDCYRRFAKDPLARDLAKRFEFSKN